VQCSAAQAQLIGSVVIRLHVGILHSDCPPLFTINTSRQLSFSTKIGKLSAVSAMYIISIMNLAVPTSTTLRSSLVTVSRTVLLSPGCGENTEVRFRSSVFLRFVLVKRSHAVSSEKRRGGGKRGGRFRFRTWSDTRSKSKSFSRGNCSG